MINYFAHGKTFLNPLQWEEHLKECSQCRLVVDTTKKDFAKKLNDEFIRQGVFERLVQR